MNVAILATYAFALAGAVGSGAWLLERGLMGLHLPARWVWVVALVASVSLPLSVLVAGPAGNSATGATGMSGIVVQLRESQVDQPETGVADDDVGAAEHLLLGLRRATSGALTAGASLLPPISLTRGMIAGLWGLASILVATVMLTALLRLHGEAKGWPQELMLGRRVTVSPTVGPATLGLFSPRIVIPRWARRLPPPELELVLRHEEEHVRSRDTFLLGIGLLAAVACPWNPVVWWQVRRLNAAVEVDCDRRVLGNGIAPQEYGKLLVRLASRRSLGSLAVPTLAGSTSQLERRLMIMKNTLDGSSFTAVVPALSLGLLLVVVACTAEAPVATEPQAQPDPSISTSSQATAETLNEEVVTIWVDQDGTVQINGEVHPLSEISQAVALLNSPNTVVSIEAHRAAPYRILSSVQDEIRAAGLLRVVFTTAESEAQRSASRDLTTLVEEGLTMVLPDSTMPNISQMNVSRRNLLFLDVRSNGLVGAQLGQSQAIREVVAEEVESLWRQAVAQNPSLIAVVRTHPEAEYRHMYAVLDALQRAEATRFTLELAE